MVQPVDDRLLRGDLGFGLGDLWLKAARVQPCQGLALMDPVALLRQDGGDPPAHR